MLPRSLPSQDSLLQQCLVPAVSRKPCYRAQPAMQCLHRLRFNKGWELAGESDDVRGELRLDFSPAEVPEVYVVTDI